jgi:hypothetical protein
MMKRVAWFLFGVSVCYACGNAESASKGDSISGTYVREYSSEILNELSGNKVGVRTVRDTIFISSTEAGYKIENAKWSMNDYDEEGWRNMEHSEVRPLEPFEATYNSEDGVLSPKVSGVAPNLIINNNGELLVGKNSKPYLKL